MKTPAINPQPWIEFLKSPSKVVVTTHFKPDGDAMGSMLAFARFLEWNGFEVTAVSPSEWPEFLNWLPGTKNVIDFQKNPRKANKAVKEAAWVICLDLNDLARLDDLQKIVGKHSARVAMIDHHLDPKIESPLVYHDTQAAATCELVYRLIHACDQTQNLDKAVAECLYTGIMTDSGSFRFASTSPLLHRIAADLLEKGVQPAAIHEKILDQTSENKLRFLGYLYSNKLKRIHEVQAAYFMVTKEEMSRFQVTNGDLEGLVNVALSIQGVNIGILMVERPNQVKLSFRSKGEIGVNLFASTYFQGGGHFHAAGGSSNLSLEETETRLLTLITPYYSSKIDENA